MWSAKAKGTEAGSEGPSSGTQMQHDEEAPSRVDETRGDTWTKLS